jgi:hypothetical protein
MSHETLFIDTNIPMYAVGREHPLKVLCQHILTSLTTMTGVVTDTEVLQEILYRYWSLGEPDRGLRLASEFLIIVPDVVPVTKDDVERALALAQRYPSAPPRDLIHVAVMLDNGVRRIVSADRHFDQFTEIERIAPDGFAHQFSN